LNKEKLNLDALKIETLLSPGQTLLLGPTPDVKGLGEYFFTVDRHRPKGRLQINEKTVRLAAGRI
jgi:hypothetical protein